MYRKLFFFAWVNDLQVWWAGLAHRRVTRDKGVCSWEKGKERLPLDWHQCLELAVSYLGILILWELSSPNEDSQPLLFFFPPSGCWMSVPPIPQNQTKLKSTKNQNQRTKQTSPTFPIPCSLYHKKTWGLK